MPSDYVAYYFELADNDAVSGPKISKSRTYIARLPSLEEIIAQTEAEYNQNVDQTEEYLRQHRDLSERLKNIARKFEQEKITATASSPGSTRKNFRILPKKRRKSRVSLIRPPTR